VRRVTPTGNKCNPTYTNRAQSARLISASSGTSAGRDWLDVAGAIEGPRRAAQQDFWPESASRKGAHCGCRNAFEFEAIADHYADPERGDVWIVVLRYRPPQSHVGHGCMFWEGSKVRLECAVCGRWIKWVSIERYNQETAVYSKRNKPDSS
jgi:hypothetical protein